MNECEDREEGLAPSKTSLYGEDGSQTEPQSSENQERPDSPVSSCVSMRSDASSPETRERPAVSSCVSMKSDASINLPLNFKGLSSETNPETRERPDCPVSSCVSMKSDASMKLPLNLKGLSSETKVQESFQVPSGQSPLDSVFMLIEENIFSFVKTELKMFQHVLTLDQESLKRQRQDEEVDTEEKEQKRSIREALLKITLHYLRAIKHEDLADLLQSRSLSGICQRKVKSNLKKRFQCVFEGIAKTGNPTLLNQIYTELYITEGGAAEVNKEHEIRQIEGTSRKPADLDKTIKCENIFKSSHDQPIRTVLTNGVAGIGKTVLTQKFTLDWAEDKANRDIEFIFPFTFRELNVLREEKFSLVELVHHFFTETKEAGICRFEDFQVVFIFDGLDECRPPLDFHNTKILTDVTESTSVDVLLINLIRGKLLPSAHIWITTRPAAASQIPPQCVDMVTEVRGFTEPQKEEYFRKRFRDEEQASRIISHITKSRSLHIMCHIPVFCWITATVLEDVLETREGGEVPKTLTEMYIHFLVVQTKVKKVKYDGGAETDVISSPESREMIESLGKLAFDQLQKGNLIFYESDLTECGIDIRAASVYSGVFTQIFKEESGIYLNKVFCFVHLSVQEFLAALHVHLTFINSGVSLLEEQQTPSQCFGELKKKHNLKHLHQCAVDKSLESPNGHLDMFLRFLLGLSAQSSPLLYQMKEMENRSKTNKKTAKYIKKKINEDLHRDRSTNLFYCLNELNDHSLIEETQQHLTSEGLTRRNLSPAQWSALAFMLLSSGKDLDEFDLKKFSDSEEVFFRMLPVIKASKRALLNNCNLSEKSCEALASVLSSQLSSLRELDLSSNDLLDAGVELLSRGLGNPNCTLETLRLAGCQVTEKGCGFLTSALTSNPSHLKELDLNYNHLGDSGVQRLSARKEDPLCKLAILRTDHGGEHRLTPGLRKYGCELTLDQDTAHRKITLSDNNKKATAVDEKQREHFTPETFLHCQVLCTEALTDRCYWEVEWTGVVLFAVAYKTIQRKGKTDDSWFGCNTQSWSLHYSNNTYSVWHNKTKRKLPFSASPSDRVAVFVDRPAGTISFYKISHGKQVLLHTFYATLTESLHPGFGFAVNSSVTLCNLNERKSSGYYLK